MPPWLLSQGSCPNSDNNIGFRMTNIHKTKRTEILEYFDLQWSFPFHQTGKHPSTDRILSFFLHLCSFFFQYGGKIHTSKPVSKCIIYWHSKHSPCCWVVISSNCKTQSACSLSLEDAYLPGWAVSWCQRGCPFHLHTLINIPKMFRESDLDGIPHTFFPVSFLRHTWKAWSGISI